MTDAAETPAPVIRPFVGNNLLAELYKKTGKLNRRSRHLTRLRTQLCQATGVTPVKLGRWLNNQDQPDLAQAAACAQVLGISLDALCNFSTPDQPAGS